MKDLKVDRVSVLSTGTGVIGGLLPFTSATIATPFPDKALYCTVGFSPTEPATELYGLFPSSGDFFKVSPPDLTEGCLFVKEASRLLRLSYMKSSGRRVLSNRVAYVVLISFSSAGAGVARLTTTATRTVKTNKMKAKYK